MIENRMRQEQIDNAECKENRFLYDEFSQEKERIAKTGYKGYFILTWNFEGQGELLEVARDFSDYHSRLAMAKVGTIRIGGSTI